MNIRIPLVALLWCCTLLASAQTLPPGMVADTAFAPFYWGVGSFDPTQDHVLLWTKLDPGGSIIPITLTWETFADPGLTIPVSSGTVTADASTNWTYTADASFPQAGVRYWYRWRDAIGHKSAVGRTQTAPPAGDGQARLAVMSCSSVFSGYFNAYRRVGERHDIDLVVHLGDYIYDYPDADEMVRIPTPAPVDPQTLAEWRDRHAYYLLDPDLRLARQQHPWALIWDNHDTDGDTPQYEAESKQAFLEYCPMRLQNAARPDLIYRKLAYGDLLDILLVDATTLRDRDTLPGGEFSILSDSQWTWLSQELTNSTARWRVIGQERMVAQFSTAGLGSLINYGDGPVADSGAWDGYNADRVRLLSHLDQHNIDNNILLSGDIHMSFACDLPIDYGAYDAQTGAGSVAVEFLPTSISRGNFDEAGITGFLAQLVAGAIAVANPHHVYAELTSHGYGILDVRMDTVTAEFWYSPILQQEPTENFATGYRCLAGENHWQRDAINAPTVGTAEAATSLTDVQFRISPNPAIDHCTISIHSPQKQQVQMRLVHVATGQILYSKHLTLNAKLVHTEPLDVAQYPSGNYAVQLLTKDKSISHILLIQHP